MVDYTMVENAIREARQLYKVKLLGVDPYTKGSTEVTELLQGEHGIKDWVEAKYTVELDIDKLGDKMIQAIEDKRAALGI